MYPRPWVGKRCRRMPQGDESLTAAAFITFGRCGGQNKVPHGTMEVHMRWGDQHVEMDV